MQANNNSNNKIQKHASKAKSGPWAVGLWFVLYVSKALLTHLGNKCLSSTCYTPGAHMGNESREEPGRWEGLFAEVTVGVMAGRGGKQKLAK